ncbi:Avirulence protein (Avh) [Phytophthora palmivora]|uniref:Avirulence protein (Avh) n=1 Tax=Phytophthora palmivora TaxID=4796 RepID=A0A2P4YKL5_9STRA|nr:Avirulence protein (Avh) [Phytophthora palmivora]
MRLSISALVLFLSVATPCVCGDAFSTPSDSAVKAGNSVNLRGVKLATADDNTLDEERKTLILGSVKKSSTGLTIAKIVENHKFTELLENRGLLFKAMAGWSKDGKTAKSIYDSMLRVGKTTDEAYTVFRRYSNYLERKIAMDRIAARKPQ